MKKNQIKRNEKLKEKVFLKKMREIALARPQRVCIFTMKYKIKLKKVNSLLALLIYRPRSLSSIFKYFYIYFFSILFAHTDFIFTHNMRHITIIIMCSVSVVLTHFSLSSFIQCCALSLLLLLLYNMKLLRVQLIFYNM